MSNENENRASRASQTREKEARKKVWTPPSSLDAPPAPNGFRHRWVRIESMGFQDTKNVSGRLRSGYEMVRADEYPDSDYPVIGEGKYAGVIGVGGLVLTRAQYYAEQGREQDQAVENDLMKEQHPSMPINVDRQTRVTFGGTKK